MNTKLHLKKWRWKNEHSYGNGQIFYFHYRRTDSTFSRNKHPGRFDAYVCTQIRSKIHVREGILGNFVGALYRITDTILRMFHYPFNTGGFLKLAYLSEL